MKPVQKLEADRQRHANAIEAALSKTSLLKEQLQGQDGPLLTRQQRDEYVHHLLAHHADPYNSTALANATAAAATTFPGASSPSLQGAAQNSDWPPLQAGQGDGELREGSEGAGAGAEQVQQQDQLHGQHQHQAFGIVPPTQTLVERVRLKQLQAKLAQERSHKARHEDLAAQSVKLRKEEEFIRSREASKARTNIQVALREDDRLATLPSKQLLQELMRAGRMSSVNMLASEHLQQRRSGIDTIAPRRTLGQSTIGMPPGGTEIEEDEDEDEGEDDESYDDDDDDDAEASFGEPDRRAQGLIGGLDGGRDPAGNRMQGPLHGFPSGVDDPNYPDNLQNARRQRTQRQAQQRAQQEAEQLRRNLQSNPEQLPIHQASTIGALLQQYREERSSPINERQVQLGTLLEALKGAMPDQERALHVLRMKHEIGAIRLHWAAHRPPSHNVRESRGVTAKQQALKAMCRTMAYELVDEALSVAVMRPSKADVQRELATWKAKHTSAQAVP
ncbi:hypothetical protein DUNSADRAFT_6653 [Dunaliella salina]|uniref:Uncharacterized protein n=1 Tax=Dunaliella salina TaxID=3046 RepID=A0ABQ7GMZ2_DUNSA|nr:hypothetical protein DUNSADRAFT_6653 [Dunaliella salina]|eukprot:KAF5835942.1 hypothetical protein DUNSADRAFT_6653 [Dunaliella salina]